MNEVSTQLVGYSFFFASLIVSIPSFFFEEFTNIINVYVVRKHMCSSFMIKEGDHI